MWAWHWNGSLALWPARLTIQLKLSVVNGPPRSDVNTNDPADSLWSFLSSRSSSPRIGCVAGLPFLARRTCISALTKSMADHSRSTISPHDQKGRIGAVGKRDPPPEEGRHR